MAKWPDPRGAWSVRPSLFTPYPSTGRNDNVRQVKSDTGAHHPLYLNSSSMVLKSLCTTLDYLQDSCTQKRLEQSSRYFFSICFILCQILSCKARLGTRLFRVVCNKDRDKDWLMKRCIGLLLRLSEMLTHTHDSWNAAVITLVHSAVNDMCLLKRTAVQRHFCHVPRRAATKCCWGTREFRH